MGFSCPKWGMSGSPYRGELCITLKIKAFQKHCQQRIHFREKFGFTIVWLPRVRGISLRRIPPCIRLRSTYEAKNLFFLLFLLLAFSVLFVHGSKSGFSRT
ncbi:MAG: hypothetical protein UW22_C0086G0006 [Candidatus Gottesmanbacteria bacterium GW2011_GWB1_44_11c]|uniref:Uncharacterized protein n=1 Tax=Candidatus Gottesmanbacteria bacterium GW2011_GWB1_44_11c TaxID=1618447 RepID=A0A0G1GHD2_9BACT|nr:MAG: hypothetical protein UW22_C0086G0006 [Candidatus Gottesmanbacteria bacterium GW2011_GWB1_44_11c]